MKDPAANMYMKQKSMVPVLQEGRKQEAFSENRWNTFERLFEMSGKQKNKKDSA